MKTSRSVFFHAEANAYPHKNLAIKNMDGENWRPIQGYNDMYEVSNLGRVKCRIESEYMVKIFILKQTITSKGYARVRFSCQKSDKKTLAVHRLVAYAFIHNHENKPTVNHKDGNKLNNRIENLEWSTNQENTLHAYEIGLITIKSGEDCSTAKLRNEVVLSILHDHDSTKDIAKKYSIHENTVLNIKSGRSWGKITGRQNKNSFAKAIHTNLTPESVVEIFNANGRQIDIAKSFSISKSTVWRIKSGTCFSDITGKKIV